MAVTPMTATVTGQTGPGLSVSSLALSNVTEVNFNFTRGVVTVSQSEPPVNTEYELSNMTTLTINATTRAVVLST
jgi:hypothetical protein